MAKEDDKSPGGEAEAAMAPDERLAKVLEARWDPGKMSSFMRRSESSRAQRLDASQRSRFEGRLGVDLGEVRVFSGELAQEITRAHNAEALTVGDTGMILMRNSAAFAPGSASGTALLAHELTHVAQAKPTVSRKKTSTDLADEDASEAEAEKEEAKVLAEEIGLPPTETDAEKDEQDRDKKEKILKKVLELLAEEDWNDYLRTGQRQIVTPRR